MCSTRNSMTMETDWCWASSRRGWLCVGRGIPLPYTCWVPPPVSLFLSSQSWWEIWWGRCSPPSHPHLHAEPACRGTTTPLSCSCSCVSADSSQSFASVLFTLSPSEPNDLLKTLLFCPAETLLPHMSTLFLSIYVFPSSLCKFFVCFPPVFICVAFSVCAHCHFVWICPSLQPLWLLSFLSAVFWFPFLNCSPWLVWPARAVSCAWLAACPGVHVWGPLVAFLEHQESSILRWGGEKGEGIEF